MHCKTTEQSTYTKPLHAFDCLQYTHVVLILRLLYVSHVRLSAPSVKKTDIHWTSRALFSFVIHLHNKGYPQGVRSCCGYPDFR